MDNVRIRRPEQQRLAEAREYIDRISRQWDDALGRLKLVRDLAK